MRPTTLGWPTQRIKLKNSSWRGVGGAFSNNPASRGRDSPLSERTGQTGGADCVVLNAHFHGKEKEKLGEPISLPDPKEGRMVRVQAAQRSTHYAKGTPACLQIGLGCWRRKSHSNFETRERHRRIYKTVLLGGGGLQKMIVVSSSSSKKGASVGQKP